MLIDEGGSSLLGFVIDILIFSLGGYSEQYGGVFAVPAVGEKGYIDTRVEVSTPGGHSSIPPVHTVSRTAGKNY